MQCGCHFGMGCVELESCTMKHLLTGSHKAGVPTAIKHTGTYAANDIVMLLAPLFWEGECFLLKT